MPKEALIARFNTEFKGEQDKLYLDFKAYLKKCVEQWTDRRSSSLYAPIATGLQSSGHGKTKTMYHFAKSNFVVYVCLRDEESFGIPITSPISEIFLDYMRGRENATVFLFNLIKASLEKIKEINENDNVHDKYQEFNKYQPWLINHKQSNPLVNQMTESILSGLPSHEKSQTTEVEGLHEYYRNSGLNQNNTPLFIFLDDACSLQENSFQRTCFKSANGSNILSKFNIMLLAVIRLCKYLPIVFFLADSNDKFAEIFSEELEITSSSRHVPIGPHGRTVYHSFYKFLYTDEFAPEQYKSSLRDPKKLYTTILNRNPKENLFLFGRPLWSHVTEPLELAKEKLINASCWTSIEHQDDCLFASLAILSVRTTLQFNFDLVHHKELVSRYLSTLFYIEEERNNYAST
jgi:hypothetical protein